MSDRPPEHGKRGQATDSVHAGELRQQEANAITTPIYQTSTFWFKDSQEVIDYNEGRTSREEYGRYGNPTWRSVDVAPDGSLSCPEPTCAATEVKRCTGPTMLARKT